MMSSGQGGSFGSGFLGGAISSGLSSATQNAGTAAMIGAGGISGGLGSALGGGSFWDGLGQGLTVSGLNHAAHVGYSYLDATIHVKAVRAFLQDLGFDATQVRGDVVRQTDGFFGSYYAMLLNEDRYIGDWTEQIDSRGGIGYVSPSRSLSVASRPAKWGIQEIRTSFALKFYPGRSSSIGIIRPGFGHYIESFLEVLDGGVRKASGHDNVIYDMHFRNSRDYLMYR